MISDSFEVSRSPTRKICRARVSAPVVFVGIIGRAEGPLTDFSGAFCRSVRQNPGSLTTAPRRGSGLDTKDDTMHRRRLLVPILGILAANPALGSEFHFDARVDVVPVLAVDLASRQAAAENAVSVRVAESQDRCLSVSWSVDGERWQGLAPAELAVWTPPEAARTPVILRIDLD
ncbi:MAG TPA: hypothetical protein PLH84_00570 [Candidatus Krumholzibacteria bacterium]|nr:hypothetical protein [Candidatus Krumholzibacteria bacterium]